MNSYRISVSLILLVMLFFIVYPFQTTYAYFTDQATINGNLKLTTGTLSLADIATISQTFHTETEHTLVTSIQNTGSLDGKLTITAITSTQNNQAIDYKDYLDVAPNFSSSSINSNVKQTLSVKLTKKKDWIKEQPIVLSISVRISQANLAQDTHGFSDEKIYKITIINDQPKDENVDWPGFVGNGKVEQLLYHSVVDNKLTTVLPGIVYLKYEGQYKEKFEAGIREKLVGTDNIKYQILDLKYIENRGFRVVLERSNTTGYLGNHYSSGIQMNYTYEEDGQWFTFSWTSTAIPFSQQLVIKNDFKGNDLQRPNVDGTIEIHPSKMEEIAFIPFHEWREADNPNPDYPARRLSSAETAYFKENLDVVVTNKKNLDATFSADYSSMKLTAKTIGDLGKIQLRNKKTQKIVFERNVKTKAQSGSKAPSIETPMSSTTIEAFSESTHSTETTVESTSQEQLISTTSTEASSSTMDSQSQSSESIEETSFSNSESEERMQSTSTTETSSELQSTENLLTAETSTMNN